MANPWNGKHNFINEDVNTTTSSGGNNNSNNHNSNRNSNNNNNNNNHNIDINNNSSSSSNTTGNNGKKRGITSSNLLAANFVPNNLRAINTAPVSAIIQTEPSQCMDEEIKCVFHDLVDFRTDQAQIVKATNEAAFANDQAKKRLVLTIPSIGRDLVPGEINVPGTTQHYIGVFRELLQAEYVETWRLYEQAFNQYRVTLGIPEAASTNYGKNSKGVAQILIMGIADGRPSLSTGAEVFIRPHGLVNLPEIIPRTQNYLQPLYQHPKPQMVQINSHVVSIIRGNPYHVNPVKQKDKVLISCVEDPFLERQLRNRKCNVRFVPETRSHERCLTALNWLRSIDPVVARDLLYPSQSPKLPPQPVVDENIGDWSEYEQLNANQAKFVQMVTTRTAYPTKERLRPPMILTGPAGTGKTKTILVSILQILHKEQKESEQNNQGNNERRGFTPRILVCTPSHTAADVITERLAKLLFKQQKERCTNKPEQDQHKPIRNTLFRLYDSSRPIETVPVQILPYTRQRDDGKWSLPTAKELLRFSVVVSTCKDSALLFLAGATNSSLLRRRNCLQLETEQRLRSSGLTLTGKINGADHPYWTHLFIDEAAQATEPESLIPMSVVVDDNQSATKAEIALCGDPRQLGPQIYSGNCENLQRSLLERLLRLPVDTYGGGREHLMGPPSVDTCNTLDEMIEYSFQKLDHRQYLSVFLNLSYRGHPSFLIMPSTLFYFDKLKSAVKYHETINQQREKSNADDNKWIRATRQIELLSKNAFPESLTSKQMDWPMVFHGVIGKCTSMAIESFFGSNCWCNHAEAEAVVQIIEKVLSAGVSTASIGVMCSFRAQVVLVRRMLRLKNLGSINVGMVEDYQSAEYDVIVLSVTRANEELMIADVSSGEGLLRQPKRMNVALTRAENLLVVVGNPRILKEDISWSKWLGFCKANGLWYGDSGEGELDKLSI